MAGTVFSALVRGPGRRGRLASLGFPGIRQEEAASLVRGESYRRSENEHPRHHGWCPFAVQLLTWLPDRCLPMAESRFSA
jgi:hypothetical protein